MVTVAREYVWLQGRSAGAYTEHVCKNSYRISERGKQVNEIVGRTVWRWVCGLPMT